MAALVLLALLFGSTELLRQDQPETAPPLQQPDAPDRSADRRFSGPTENAHYAG